MHYDSVDFRMYLLLCLSILYSTGCIVCCETWSLTLREEHRLRVFETNVLMKIFGAKKDEITGERRKLHNAGLHALYSSPSIIIIIITPNY